MHAIAAIQVEHDEKEKYVHGYYSKEVWVRAYAGIIYLIPDSRFWTKTTYNGLLPPEHTTKPGRKRKKRIRVDNEPVCSSRLSKRRVVMKCSNCQEQEHNSRPCNNQHKLKEVVYITRGRGRLPSLPYEEDKLQEAQPPELTADQFVPQKLCTY